MDCINKIQKTCWFCCEGHIGGSTYGLHQQDPKTCWFFVKFLLEVPHMDCINKIQRLAESFQRESTSVVLVIASLSIAGSE